MSQQRQNKKMKSYNHRERTNEFGHFDDFVNRAFGDDFFKDPFEDLRGFGSFGGFGGFGQRMKSDNMIKSKQHDDFFEDFGNGMMANFSSFNSNFGGGRGSQGTVITNSYVSSINYDKNGNPIKKEYSSQGIDQINKDGTKISEKQQAYKDYEKGIKKASHQRLLNDVGQKIVKTKDYKNNHEYEDNYLHGINEGKKLISLNYCLYMLNYSLNI